MQIEVETVPIDRFIPMPPGAENRHIPVGTFGDLKVLVLDPYRIALSKLDRGFDSDIEDVVFLVSQGLIEFEILEPMIENAAVQSVEFDLDPNQMRVHLELVHRALNND